MLTAAVTVREGPLMSCRVARLRRTPTRRDPLTTAVVGLAGPAPGLLHDTRLWLLPAAEGARRWGRDARTAAHTRLVIVTY